MPVPNSYGGAIGWDGAGPLALEQTGPLALLNRAPTVQYYASPGHWPG